MTIEQYEEKYNKELQEGYQEMLYDLWYWKTYVENTSDWRDDYVKDSYKEFLTIKTD